MAQSAEAEVLKLRELEERIKAPCIWGRAPSGVRFEDLQERRYDDAIRLLKHHYLLEEIPYKVLKITEDKEGVDEFVHNARIWLKDKMSIAAVKEGEDKLVGVLVMRIQEKGAFSRTFSRVKLTYNPIYTTIMTYFREIEKTVDVYSSLDVRKYMKVYALAVKPRYRHRGIAKELLRAGIQQTASASIAAIAGIFTAGRIQTLAAQLGFNKLNEVYYSRYLVDEKLVFYDTGQGNYGGALMAFRIPDVEEPPDVQRELHSRFDVTE